jgi:hypothetical protein
MANIVHEKGKQGIYDIFVLWNATPITSRERDERTLSAFSIKYSVSRDTLYRWIKSDCFVRDLKKTNADLEPYHTQQVENSMIDSAVYKLNPTAMELYLKYHKKYSDKIDITHSGKVGLTLSDIQIVVSEAIKEKK